MSDVNIDHIEVLVGPLPQGREWERWCEYTQPLSLAERGKADAALAEAYEKIQELDDKLMEAEGAHENDTDLQSLITEAAKYGEVPEQVRLYATNRRYMPVGYGREAMLRLADDATANLLALVVKLARKLTEAEAEAARLRCCGNCEHFSSSLYACELWPGHDKDAPESCHFAPPRWQRRQP